MSFVRNFITATRFVLHQTNFAQTQGRCAQEKSTMQHDILLALDDMMSHKQKVLCSLDAK